jgi:transcription elongation GreA/GreB family factor
MFNNEGIGAKKKDLEKQRDMLVDEIKKLEERRKKGEFDENIYKEKRREIERAIVEVMDRLAQMNFLSGQL